MQVMTQKKAKNWIKNSKIKKNLKNLVKFFDPLLNLDGH